MSLKQAKFAVITWVISLIVFFLLIVSPYNSQETPVPDFITIVFILDVLVGVVAFCYVLIFGFLYITKNKNKNNLGNKAIMSKSQKLSTMNRKQKAIIVGLFLSTIFVLLLYTIPNLNLCRVSRNVKETGYKTICLTNYEEFAEGHSFDSKTPLTTPDFIYQKTIVYISTIGLVGGLLFFLLKK